MFVIRRATCMDMWERYDFSPELGFSLLVAGQVQTYQSMRSFLSLATKCLAGTETTLPCAWGPFSPASPLVSEGQSTLLSLPWPLFKKKQHAKLHNICVIWIKAGGWRGQGCLVDVATRAAVPNTAYQGKSGRVQNACIWWPSDKSLGISSNVVVTIEPTKQLQRQKSFY